MSTALKCGDLVTLPKDYRLDARGTIWRITDVDQESLVISIKLVPAITLVGDIQPPPRWIIAKNHEIKHVDLPTLCALHQRFSNFINEYVRSMSEDSENSQTNRVE